MSNELIAHLANTPSKWTEDDFAVAASGGGADYLDYIKLMTSNSAECKDGSFPINHFALMIGDVAKDLGSEFDAVLISRRPKAVQFGGDAPITSYDVKSDLFQNIAAQSTEADSGCMFGTEYLMWIPAVKKFATFLFGSKSARKESKVVNDFIGHGVTFKAKKCETAKYTWFIPTCYECSSLTQSDLPDMEKLESENNKFNNPEEPKIEMAAPATDGRER